MSETSLITELVAQLSKEPIPDEIYSVVKGCLLDYLGVALAGAHELKAKLGAFLSALPDEAHAAPVIGMQTSAGMENAALLNGISAHYFDLDDGSRFGMIHLGAPVFSALLSLYKPYRIEPKLFLRAALVGYETALRLAMAIQPSHKKRGHHATGTCGCIGAAAAAAVAMGLSEQGISNTVAAAAASAAGLLEMIEDSSELKPFNAGKAAQNAITAALIGASGFAGPMDPIGGKRGVVKVMADEFKAEAFDRSSNKYAILGIYKKPYASCRHCHSAVEAALTLQRSIEADDIESITVNTYGLAVFGHDHTNIPSVGSAKMSIPYSVAAAIALGTGGIEAMTESAAANERILALTKLVEVKEDPEFSSLVPQKRIAQVVIKLRSGETLSEKVAYPKGEPENPMSAEELELKFRQLAEYAGKDKEYCDRMIDRVDSMLCDPEAFDALIDML